MFGKKKDENATHETDQQKKMRSRGTQDDMEVLRLVVSENRGLQMRVLDKLRAILADSEKYGETFRARNEQIKKGVNKPS